MINKSAPQSATSLNIDIFRTILAQWIIIGHLGPAILEFPLVPGRFAVWSFFIISGYLNAISFKYRMESTCWTEATKGYYLSRIKRIYPLLIFSYCVVSIFLGTWQNSDWRVLFPYMYSFHGELSNGVLWTLIIEIQLYVLTPLLFFLAFRLRDLHWAIQAVIAIGLVFSIPLLHVYLGGNRDLIDDRTAAGNMGFYLFGMMLALGQDKRPELNPKIVRILWGSLMFLGIYFLVKYNFVSQAVQFTTGQFVALLASFLVLVSVRPLLSKGQYFFRFLGYYTYEIYVMHGLLVFVFHQLKLTGVLAMIFFWWLFPILLVIVFDVIFKKKYRDLMPKRPIQMM